MLLSGWRPVFQNDEGGQAFVIWGAHGAQSKEGLGVGFLGITGAQEDMEGWGVARDVQVGFT